MIKSAIYIDDSGSSRQIVVIAGIPFYRSSGLNSGFEGTWLPFLGIASEHLEGTYSASIIHGSYIHTEKEPWVRNNLSAEMRHYFRESNGWFIKLENVFGIEEEKEEEDSFFKDIMAFAPRRKKTILDRVSRPILAVISASLGGGFWETDTGDSVYSFLKEKYPIDAIRANFGVMEPEVEFSGTNFKDVNEWLLVQGAAVNVMRRLQDRLSTGMPEGLDVSSGVPRTSLKDVYSFVDVAQQESIISNLQEAGVDFNDVRLRAIYMPITEFGLAVDRTLRELSAKYLFVPPVNESEAICKSTQVPVYESIPSVTRAMSGMLRENIEELALSCELGAVKDCELGAVKDDNREKIRESFDQISLYASGIMKNFVAIGDKLSACERRLESLGMSVNKLSRFRHS